MRFINIQDLDDAVLQDIFAKLPSEELKNLHCLCRRFRKLVNSNIKYLEIVGHPQTLLPSTSSWPRQWPALKMLILTGIPTAPFSVFLKDFPNETWKLEELRIECGSMGLLAAIHLARLSSSWPNLKVLSLSALESGPRQLEQLATGSWSQLQELCFVCNTTLSMASWKAFAKFLSRCSNLKYLHCNNCRLYDDALSHILNVRLPLLEHVNAVGNDIGSTEGRIIANNSSSWPSLRKLFLSSSPFGTQGLIELSEADFPLLECLEVRDHECQGDGIDADAMVALRHAIQTRWTAMKCLKVDGVDADGHVAFLEGTYQCLEELRLSTFKEAAALQALANAGGHGRLESLKTLSIDISVYEDDIDELAEAFENVLLATWPNVSRLEIDAYDLEDLPNVTRTLSMVLQLNFPAVQYLAIFMYKMTSEAVEAIFAHPWPSVTDLKINLNDEWSISAFVDSAIVNLPNLQTLHLKYPEGEAFSAISGLLNDDARCPGLKEIRKVRDE